MNPEKPGTLFGPRKWLVAIGAFAVVAYNSFGLESDFSAELAFTPIVLPLVIETSPDLRSWARLTNFSVFTSEEQAFFRLRVGP
jgi:hypothetical protein